MVTWAASLTAMSLVQAAFGGRNIQVDRVSRGTATFSSAGSLTTITASNHAIINYKQFDLANGQTVQFVQPGVHAKVLNRINSNAPSMLDGTMLANGIVYFVNPAGVIFGPHSIISVSGIIAAAGNITDNNFLANVDHFSGTSSLVNNGTINAKSAQLIGQSVNNHGTINAPGGLVAMIAGQDVLLGTNGSNILVKIGTTNSSSGVSNDGTINAAGGSASLVSGDLYSVALGTPSVIKANQVNVQGGAVSISGKIDASNANGNGGSVSVTGQTIAVQTASINANGTTGGGTIKIGGDFHAASDLPLAQTTNISADSTITADATQNGNGGQVAIWSSMQTDFAGHISAAGAGNSGIGGFVEISSKGSLLYPGTVYVGGTAAGGSVLLDPVAFDIAPSNSGGSDATGAQIASDVATSGGNYTVTASSEIFVHDTIDISSTSNTLTLDAPTIDFNRPVLINTGSLNLLGSSAVTTVNVHNGGLIQNGIDVFSASTALYPLINVDSGTYNEDIVVRQGSALGPITIVDTDGGTITIDSLVVPHLHPIFLDGSFTATTGFTIDERLHAGLPNPVLGTPTDLTLNGTIKINNNGTALTGSIDTNDQNVTLMTDSLVMDTAAAINNFGGTSGQGVLTIEPITPSTAIGIGDTTPPAAPIEIDPIDNIGRDMLRVIIGSPTGTGAITVAASTFKSPVTIQSSGTGGTITITGQFTANFFNIGDLILNGPATSGAITINAPIVTDSPFIGVTVNGDATLSSSITTIGSPIAVNGDLTLTGTAALNTANLLTTGANISVTSLSNGHGNNLTLNSGTTGSITFAGSVDNVANLTVAQSDGVTFQGTLGAGTAGNVTINGAQPASTIQFDGAANILTLTTGGSTLAYTVSFNQTAGGQTSTIQTASLSNTSGINLGNNTSDSITFTNGLNYQIGTTIAIGAVSTNGTANIDLAATVLSGNTTFTAGTTTFHNSITGTGLALAVNGNAVFDGSIPTFSSLHITGTTLLTPASVTTTGSQQYDGMVTLAAGADESFSGSSIAFNSGLTGDGNNVTVNNNATFGAVSSISHLQISANATFNDTVGVDSLTVTGTTGVSSGAITTSGDQDYQGAVTLNGNGQFISTGSGNITFAGMIDSASTPNYLFTETAGATTFEDNIGSIQPISNLQTAPFGTVQLGSGGASSTFSITTTTTAPDGEILFNNPVTLAANTTIAGRTVIFSNALDSDSTATQRDLTINAAAGTLTLSSIYAQSLTASGADVQLAGAGELHGLGNVSINATSTSPSAEIDLYGSTIEVGTATFTSPVVLYNNVAIQASGNVDFQSTLDADSAENDRLLDINTAGATIFGGNIGANAPLYGLSISYNDGTTVIGASSISVSEFLSFSNPVTLSANTTLNGPYIIFYSSIDSDSTPRSLSIVTSSSASFDGNIGSSQPLADFTTNGSGITQLGDGGSSSAISITTVTTSPDGAITFQNPTVLGANTTITSRSVNFNNTLDSDADGTPRDLTITAASGMLTFDGPFRAESLTAGPAAVFFSATGQTHELGNVIINPSGSSASAGIDLNDPDMNVTSVIYSGPVILTADVTLTAAGNVDFQSTIDSDSSATERSLTINTPGTAIFAGDVGDTHPLSSLTTNSASTDINGSSITVSGAQTYNNPVNLSASTTLNAAGVTFANTLTGNSYNLTSNAATTFSGTVSAIDVLTVNGSATTDANITSAGSQTYADALTLNADISLTGNGITIGSINGGAHQLTLNSSNGAISVNGSTTVGSLIIANSAGATFDAVTANTFTVSNTAANDTVAITGPATISTLTTTGTSNPYNLSLTGTGSTITTANLANTGTITLGGSTAFPNGILYTAGQTYLAGTVNSDNAPITFRTTSVLSSSMVDAGSAPITLGSTALSASGILTLGSGNSGSITVASITGPGNIINSDNGIIFNTTGTVTVNGTIGTGVAALTITNSGGASFAGDVSVDSVNLTATTGTINFSGSLTAETLNDAGGNFNLALASCNIDSVVTLGTTGTVTFGQGGTLTFDGIAHLNGPNILNGNITTQNGIIDLDSATSVTGNSQLLAGSGKITLGDTTLADGKTLFIGTDQQIVISPGHVIPFADNNTLPVAQTGNVTIASVSGGTSSTITFNTTGNVTIAGAVGSSAAPIGALDVEDCNTAVFGGDIHTTHSITVIATDTSAIAGASDIVFHGNLYAGGDISLSPGDSLLQIGNTGAYATNTIIFYGNTITAGGTLNLLTSDVVPLASPFNSIPSVANIVALGSPTTVNGFTGIALNIQAGTINMGTDANLSSPNGGVAISLGSGTSTVSSITALGSIDISAPSAATTNVVDRGNWKALNSDGKLVPEHGTILFAGGQGQSDILSTPDSMQTSSLTKFAVSFATSNAAAGQAHTLKSNQVLTASQIEYTSGGTTYYLLAPVRTGSQPANISFTLIPQPNQIYLQENIDFDSAMRKQFWRFGLFGRDTTLDTVDGGIVRPLEPSENQWSIRTTDMNIPATNP
jgi:filamentous hemagglutinin family protein